MPLRSRMRNIVMARRSHSSLHPSTNSTKYPGRHRCRRRSNSESIAPQRGLERPSFLCGALYNPTLCQDYQDQGPPPSHPGPRLCLGIRSSRSSDHLSTVAPLCSEPGARSSKSLGCPMGHFRTDRRLSAQLSPLAMTYRRMAPGCD